MNIFERCKGLLGRARQTTPGKQRSYRLANSVRLPWLIGLVLFLLITLAAVVLIGRTGTKVKVPQAILDNQESLTQSVAQSVRRSANEGVDDLAAFSSTLAPVNGVQTTPSLSKSLVNVAKVHDRYLRLSVIDDQGKVLAATGEGKPVDDPLKLIGSLEKPGMSPAAQLEGRTIPIILQYAPLPKQDTQARAVIGQYDPLFFSYALEAAEPGEAWLVNEDGRVIGSLGGFTAFPALPRRPLREAAARASTGESGVTIVPGSLDRREIISFAPVVGIGPAGEVGWSIVTARSVSSILLPETTTRRQILVFAIVLALMTIVVFGWLWILVLRPLLRLQGEAERLAYGDLSRNVEVIRYDEIGLTARALERIRILLIRQRVQRGKRPSQSKPSGEEES